MKIDIIIPMFGNLEVVKPCFESLYPLPENWNLIVYDNKVSEIDGTKQYLVDQQKIKNFTLIDENKILMHPSAMKVLVDNSKADWILHLDSDVELKNRNFFKWAEYVILFEQKKVWGKSQNYSYSRIRPYPDRGVSMFHLPRLHTHIVLFERDFVVQRNIDFDVMAISGKLTYGKARLSNTDDLIDGNTNLKVNGDTAWQLYWESHFRNLFGTIPDSAWKMCEHKEAASRNWGAKNVEAINKLRALK